VLSLYKLSSTVFRGSGGCRMDALVLPENTLLLEIGYFRTIKDLSQNSPAENPELV